MGPVSITLDGVADDGVAGDGVNFLADVEDIESDARFAYPDEPLPTYGPVTLVGTAAANRLTGSSGPDTITGGSGIDVLEGMAGDDTLLARDGLADRVRCGEGVDTAVVDRFDQVSDTCEVVHVEAQEPPVVVESPDDAPPRIAWRPGSALGILAEDDRGVASVQWMDDDRVICTDTTAPFDCDFKPRIADVGSNTLIAIATDTAGQTAGVTAMKRVERFKPIALALAVKRSGRRYVASGTVSLPAGVPCSGTVAVERTAKLRSNCTSGSPCRARRSTRRRPTAARTRSRPSARRRSATPPPTTPRPRTTKGLQCRPFSGRYWARTSDLRLVEAALSQLS